MPGFDQPFNIIQVMMAMWPNSTVTAREILTVISPDQNDEVFKLAKVTLDEAFDYSN